ncbi:MAG: SGNH/GDSL hydrolase family protein [Clostridia bacterium]|nr:SGNH/GDSL hydrolase family protein [Clostridia bacterium]
MRVSIFGDSISTCDGFQLPGYALYYDAENMERNGITAPGEIWWQLLLQEMQWDLCVNNAYSGCRVSGGQYPSASSGDRIRMLRSEDASPEMVLIYLGFNDFGFEVPVHPRGIAGRGKDRYFAPSYRKMLREIRAMLPETKVLCGTLMGTCMSSAARLMYDTAWTEGLRPYNEAIEKACRAEGCTLVDLAGTGVKYETLDGVHPTAAGHRTIADTWAQCLEGTAICAD